MKKKYPSIIASMVMILYLLINNAWASPPKPFEITFDFPNQGLPINQINHTNVRIEAPSGWQSGSVKIALSAIPFVVTNSNIDNIQIDQVIEFGSNDENDLITIPLTILDNGEYEIRTTITLQTEKGKLSRSRSFGVVAENGVVWFGRDSVGHAIEAKIRYLVESDLTLPSDEIERVYQKRLNAEEQQRARKSRANAGLTQILQKAIVAKAIALGDPLVLEASWVGKGTGNLGTTNGDSNFPMHGVKVSITDKDKDASNNPLTPEITGYLVNGKFSFIAPRVDYTYKVVMETDFPGTNADGTIKTAGNGIGSFKVVKQTSSGSVYTCEAEDILIVVCSQAQTGSKASYSSWAAFHGIAEMIVQAKKQLKIDKKSGFEVVFDHPGISSYSSSTSDVRINIDDRYDWDVVAHEFGHAIADETDAIDTSTGGFHDGSNQYDIPASKNPSTFHNKSKSLELAISEGFGTWFGGALMQNPSSKYNGKFQNIGDGKYDDTEDLNTHASFETNTKSAAFGEDTEDASYRLLWDIMDSNNESNVRATCSSCKDTISLGLNNLWSVLNGSKVSNIIELYEKLLEKTYSTKVSDLLKTGENNINDTGLRGALNMAYTFAEFGIAPYLELPTPKTKLDLLVDKSGPKFKWSQKKTGRLEGLTEFTLALYTFDLKTLVFTETGISANEYTLTESDINDIKSAVDGLSSLPSSLVAVIIGENDYFFELESGPYLSNPIEIMINNVDRTLVVVVDSSGSNGTTDPSNLRIEAAKETLRRLTSLTESQSNNTVPDLAGAVDFDSSITILSSLDDPDNVIPKLNSIDSSGGTDIASGINSAIQILENLNTTGLSGVLENKAAITVFTDGQNNAGDIPVIQAIVNATLKGIRVHYGFLQPFIFAKSRSFSIPSDAPPGYVVPLQKIQPRAALPATIKEAILASGGVYALIGDADSQVAFVRQIENRGFTNSDNSDPGGQSVVGQTETFDILIDSLSSRSFQFNGRVNEDVRVIVDTNGNFLPFLKIIDRDGNIVAVDDDSDADGVIKLSFTLPYTGEYHAEVTSQDGNTGQFSLFVDVHNVALPNQAPNGVIDTPSANLEITVGQAVNFTATGSDSDNNQPLEYLWAFGSGSEVANSTVEDPGNVTFNKAGVFTVMLVVTDSLGLTDPSAPTITVTVKEPILIPPAPIPTLSEWGVILLAFVMFLVGFKGIRRVNS